MVLLELSVGVDKCDTGYRVQLNYLCQRRVAVVCLKISYVHVHNMV